MKTKFYLPQNIFSRIFLSEIKNKSNFEIDFTPSSLIAKKILDSNESVGLIPTMDLISNKELFISSEIGVSFNALISNSYIHFKEEQESIDELFLKGDVTSNEVILCKILFKEFYEVDIKTTLLQIESNELTKNILLVGDENYEKELFLKGLSFSEEIIELISAPYVNYVIAGSSEEILKNFVRVNKDDFKTGHSTDFTTLFPTLPQTSLDFLSVNIQHLIFDFDEQDIEGIRQLLQLPYFHGMIKEMIDVKFV